MSIIHMDGFDHYIDEIEVSEEEFTNMDAGGIRRVYSNGNLTNEFKFSRHFNNYRINTSKVVANHNGRDENWNHYLQGPSTFIGKNNTGKSLIISLVDGYKGYAGNNEYYDEQSFSNEFYKNLKTPLNTSNIIISGLSFYPYIDANYTNNFQGNDLGSPTILQIISETEDGTFYNLAYCMYEKLNDTENRIHFTTEQSYRDGMSNYSGEEYRHYFDNQIVDLSWNFVEVKINIDTKTAVFRINGNQSVELKLNDYLFEDTDPILTGESNIKLFVGSRYIGGDVTRTQYRFAIDDLYVLDGNGTTNNDFLGNVKVLTRTPDADIESGFQRFPTESTNNYENVDSIYDDSVDDPDYNYANTIGTTDLFTSSHVIPEDIKIYGIGTAFVSRKQAGDSKNVTQIISNGDTSSEGELLEYDLDNYTGQITVFDKDPDGNDWTKETIETSQFGYEIKDTNIT